MKIVLSPSAGFCFGVKRAVELVEGLLKEGKSVYTLGPLIHNPRFVQELEDRGARVVNSPSEVPKDAVMVIRSHGVPRSVYEEAEKIGLEVVDATCPYVGKIHKLVADASQSGSVVLIAGNPSHPEVIGIKGHCSEAYVFEDLKELKEIVEKHRELCDKSIVAVAQTTFNAKEWVKCCDFMKKVYTNPIIFDTICSTTSIRRQEAEKLASQADVMIVVGGRGSSNTAKLQTLCAAQCPSFLVEGASELPTEVLVDAGCIGVTAGASTPTRIIKEVLNTMAGLENTDNLDNENEDITEPEDIDFAAALEKSFKTLSVDERVKGVVVGFSSNEVQVDLGTKHAGYVPFSELTDDPTVKPEDILNVGDEIELVVLRVNDQDGTVALSKRRIDALKSWDEIVDASEEDKVVEGTVIEVIKGGLLATVNGVKVFIPASQSGIPRSGDLSTLLHKPVNMKIIEINSGRKRAVGSIRAVLKEERKKLAEKFWEEAEIGKQYTGKVKSLTSYGAFVDLGGVDGMIHVSELSWSRIRHPSEVVNVGDTVNVTIKDLNPETKKVSLSYADKGENPWDVFAREYHVGDIVDAKIVNFMTFGAFAQIIPGVDGLIHISQIADHHVAKPQDELEMGQEVRVKIIEVEEDRKRISLSIREAEDEEGSSYDSDDNYDED
ncbi:MAG TPA: bifunctional 4-hydroxy-3-methylbut-2-enyl diphosphate reductase/30S ribosomal protein S1 [Ruminococcaceae bacterium]|nr:bifunctional 4-hydroxy-3-methylbut-2-enyl diphosphate reductase/30S ribosomal protein S1 [Oscillospiraceae bacterium]